jgi:ATP synthase protein I
MGWEACRIIIEAGRGFMQEETRKYIKLLAIVSTMGISMVLAIVIAIAIGYYLDKWFKTSPIFFLVFMVLGIIAGFRNIYIIMKRTERDLK